MKIKSIYLSIALLLTLSCSKENKPEPSPSMPVKITKAEKKDVLIYFDNIGHVESINSVNIQTRVEGQLMEIHIEEGQEVNEKDLLFTIDPRPYEAALEKAEGLLKESEANLFIAKERFLRNKSLVKDEYISQMDFDTLAAEVSKNEALVKQNMANVESARLNLNYCYIYSPISGKTGILQIDKGNMIYPNSQKEIISINQLAPIYVTFFSPEKNLPEIQKYLSQNPLKVRVAFEDLEKDYIEGTLNMINNQIDNQTGIIKLRAIFDNMDKKLWPGKFVKTRLILKTQKNAIVIPFKAVQLTTLGPIVFVIKSNSTAELRHVTLGQREDENIIILDGISENEAVVTDGQLNLSENMPVTIKTDI